MKTTVLAYHGSRHNFKEFTFEKMGKESGTSGAGYGLYFSESKADALTYGPIIYTCMLQLKHELSNEKVTLTATMLRAILDQCQKINHDYYENFGYQRINDKLKNQIVFGLLKDNDSDVEIIGGIINSNFIGTIDKMMEILSKYGFSHTTDKRTPENETITHYIIYDISCIKIQSIDKVL